MDVPQRKRLKAVVDVAPEADTASSAPEKEEAAAEKEAPAAAAEEAMEVEEEAPAAASSAVVEEEAPLRTPVSGGASGAGSGSGDGDLAEEALAGMGAELEAAAAPAPTPRTHIVKERVKEERTFMDERGYLVCEEVWVEREVEREYVPPKPKASGAGGSSAPATLKPAMIAPKPKAVGPKQPRGLVTEDAEEPVKKAKGGGGGAKSKAAPAKVVTGAGSIMGFFGKK